METIPAGFRRERRGPRILICAESWHARVAALELLAPGRARALLDDAASGGSGRGATAIAELAGEERLLLRRLLHGGLLGSLLGSAFWGVSRPLRELAVTAELRREGVPVPEPVLVAGERIFGPWYRCIVGTRYEEDSRDALAFLEADLPAERVLALAHAAGRAVRTFHDAGGRHGDLHVKNLLVQEDESTGSVRVTVIDLDKTRITPGLTPDERMAQLVRLLRSLVKRGVMERVGTRGCAAFFGSYCAGDRPLRRALWRRVDHELRKAAVHAIRYSGRMPKPR